MTRFISVVALATALGCTASPEPTAAPPKAAAPPSDVARLAATERVVAEPGSAQPAAERAIASASQQLATCFRHTLDRDPTVAGSLRYGLQLGAGGTATGRVTKAGDLADLPSATCAADVLAKLSIDTDLRDVDVTYEVTFSGRHRAADLQPNARTVHLAALAADWAAPTGDLAKLGRPIMEAKDAFGLCLRATQAKAPPTWVVLRLTESGHAVLDDKDWENDETDLCLRRRLGALTFEARPTAAIAVSFDVVDEPRPAVTPIPPAGPPPIKVPKATRGGSDETESGMAGLLGSGDGPDSLGSIWGDEIGDSFGSGGLGLRGTGTGGGGAGVGMLGVGSVGTIGRGGIGAGQGFGSGSGRLGGKRSKPPSVRNGETAVVGKLDKHIIQRIVRQNTGRFRLCYENGLRNNPSLSGRVKVDFVINTQGDVSSASGSGDLPDQAVVSCVTKAFRNLSFPKPEGGIVKVAYPLVFSPGGDDAPAGNASDPLASGSPKSPPPPEPPKVDGKPLPDVDAIRLSASLEILGYETRFVPVPDGQLWPPLVFFRSKSKDELGYVLLLKGPPPAHLPKACARSHGGVTLVAAASAPVCETVMRGLVD